MPIAKHIASDLERASYVRKMFEQGEELKKRHGAENIYDFSLGNPEVEPPDSVRESFIRNAAAGLPGAHRYMSNAGFVNVREKIADSIGRRSGAPMKAGHIVMTVGAAGGINIALKTLLNPGDEVIAFAPYFKEYDFYAKNHGGSVVAVPTDGETFKPGPAALEAALSARTKAVIINSPNNPSGAVYDADCLCGIADAIRAGERKFGTDIYVISDEPYINIVYDGIEAPHVFRHFKNALIVNSYSKSLALAGERIGYTAISPEAADADAIAAGLVFCNRVLGYVNAPAFMQRVVAENIEASVDIAVYAEKRDAICRIMREAGFDFMQPQGAFYLFPKIFGDDEEAFKDRAVQHNILIVPGAGFGWPGRFRLAYCVATDTILRSRNAFIALAAEFKQ
ncbi:MAG: pyridoxal phosphate-dependent aminotransferase [Oscillospiraceae bacterium]|nr:pyridoxal phosphate-dependent aminotransferase [Oscillospiraceae bacterium]